MADRSVVVRVRADVSNLKAGMESASRSIEEVGAASSRAGASQAAAAKSGVDWGSKARSAGKAAATAFTTATVATGALAVSAIKAGASYNGMQQASRAALTTILGGAIAANEQMDKLDEFASKSPFSKAVFIKAQQQLLGFGLEAKKVIPSLNAIQDAVAAVGGSNEDIASITDSLAKMQGQGKLTGKTLNELGLYGIDAASIIGEQMGKSGEEIREMASKPGGVPVDQIWDPLIEGLQGKFDGAAANVKKTWAGATDRIKAAWRDIGSSLAEPFVSKAGGGAAVQWANDVADLMRAVQKQIAPISDVLMPRLAGSFGQITPLLQTAKKAVDGFDVSNLAGGLDQIGKAAPGLAGASAALFAIGGNSLGLSRLGLSLNPVAAGLTALVMTSPEARKAVFDLLDAVSPLIPVAGQLATVLAGVASEGIGAVGGAVSAVVPLVSGLMKGVEFLANAFGMLPGPVQSAVVGLIALNIALGSLKVQAAVSSVMGMADTVRLVGMYAVGAGGPIKGVKAALSALGIGAGNAEKATGRLGKTLGGIGKAAVGIAVVGTAIAVLGNEMDKLNADKLQVDLAKSSDAAKDLDDAINSLNREGFGQGATNVRSMGDALRYTFNASTTDELLNATEAFITFGQVRTSDISVAAERIKEVDSALAGMISSGNVGQARTLMADITAEAAAQGVSVEDLARKFPLYEAAIAKAAQEAVKAEPSVGALAAAQNLAGDAAADAKGPTDALAEMMTKLGLKSEDAESALKSLKTAVDLLSGGELALRAAQRELADSIDDVKDKAKAAAEAKGKYGSKSREAAAANRDLEGSIDKVAISTQSVIKEMMENNREAGALKAAYEKGRAEIERQLTARGLHGEALKREADRIIGTREDFKTLLAEYKKTPKTVETKIVVDSTGAKVAIDNITTMLNRFNGRVVTAQVRTNYVTIGNAPMLPGTGVVTRAAGGFDAANGHQAEIAPAGAWRVWAEPETKGESYIPHANDWRRPRAKSILEQTARMFGGTVSYHAAGSVSGISALTGADRSAILTLIRAVADPIRDLANATKAMSTATAGLKAPQSALTAATAAKQRADTSVTAAQKRLDADKAATAAAKARQTAGLAEVTAAKKRLDSLKQVRTQQGLEKRELQARINSLSTAAKATKGITKADRDLAAAKKQMERLNAAILKQDKAIAAQNAKVKTAQDKTAKSQAANAKAVDKAKAKEATSSAALTKAKDAAKAATDRQKAAQDALKAAQDRAAEAAKALAEMQKRVADEAARVSDQLRSQVDGPGTNISAWIDRLATGASDVAQFAAQVEQLRKGGLDEMLLQQIIGAGVHGGSRVAANLLNDKGSIGKLNSASDSLQAAADKLGLIAATGVGRYAGGGAVGGRAGVDKNLALLTRGEHVLDTADVAAMGGQQGVYEFRRSLHSSEHLRVAPMRAVAQSAPFDYGRLAKAIVSAMPAGTDPALVAAAVESGAARGTERGMSRRDRADLRDARARTA